MLSLTLRPNRKIPCAKLGNDVMNTGFDHFVEAKINYLDDMDIRPAFYATDYSRDNLKIKAETLPIHDARRVKEHASLDREGFVLKPHKSAVSNFRDQDEISRHYLPEIQQLMLEVTGAEHVIMSPRGVLRFGERSKDYGAGVNTRPARFVHVDYTGRSVPVLLDPLLDATGFRMREGQRFIGFNVWRALSEPPQDIPLSVCDARTVAAEDLVPADAIFDAPGAPEFSFEAYLVRYNPNHRWFYFPDMQLDEVLIFKAYDSDPAYPRRVPHVAFDDPGCPPEVPPRASIEVRGFAFF